MGFKPDLRRPTGFLQCFDTVGLIIWPVKIVPEMTHNVSSGTLNPTHSLNTGKCGVILRSVAPMCVCVSVSVCSGWT